MVLAQAWRRRVYGGVMATVFVPVVLIGVLAALALSGGFGQLTALGQALAGPPAPLAPAVATRAIPRRILAALAAPAAAPRSGVALVPVARRLTASTGSGTRPRATSTPSTSAGPTSLGPSASAPPAHHRPSPGRTPHPTVIDDVVNAGSSATSSLPGPVGPVATKTLQTAGSTLDKILPPVPRTSR